MEQPLNAPNLMQWFQTHKLENVQPITKHSAETSAWFATISERDCFLKFYPHELAEPCAAIEIAGANLHPAIVPLHQSVQCREGTLLLYDRVRGENLGPMENRRRFQSLPLAERSMAVVTIFAALTAICDAGFMIVDWYEGNIIYDFSQRRIWLFDWDLCRKGDSFTLEQGLYDGALRAHYF